MKQPKWILRMEAIYRKGHGFWVDRNWNDTAYVKTTSVIDVVSTGKKSPGSGVVPVGGSPTWGQRDQPRRGPG